MSLMNKPGVYRSDVEGHLLVLRESPIRVTCVVCLETCDTSQHKEVAKAAMDFMEKHGALGERIADSILQLIPTSSEPKQ